MAKVIVTGVRSDHYRASEGRSLGWTLEITVRLSMTQKVSRTENSIFLVIFPKTETGRNLHITKETDDDPVDGDQFWSSWTNNVFRLLTHFHTLPLLVVFHNVRSHLGIASLLCCCLDGTH